MKLFNYLFAAAVTSIVTAMLAASGAIACTTMIITKGASADGSMMVAHSDDDELGDQRLIFVPAHKQTGKRQIFADQMRYPRIVTDKRGPGYNTGGTPTSPIYNLSYKEIWKILGKEVPTSYAYYDGNYGIMNEHNLMFGECTNGANFEPPYNNGTKKGPLRIFYSAELSRIALENCKTAREAIVLMGGLIDKYGLFATGETLLVADKDEAWVFEMCAVDDDDDNSVWVAQRVPDGMVFVAANEFRIREVDFKDKGHKNFYWSRHLPAGVKGAGYWDGKGKFDWLRYVSPGEYNHPYYSLRRVWRVLDRVNPDLGLSPWVKDGYTEAYPFAVAPMKKLRAYNVFGLYRDHYEGTQFDMTKGVAAGPYGDPHRFVGPYDGPQNNIGGERKMYGAWERAISVFYQGYTFVCQYRPEAPEATRGILWFGPDVSYTTCFAPFFTRASGLNKAYSEGSPQKLDRNAAWWAFDYLNTLSRNNFQRMTDVDIIPLQRRLEYNSMRFIRKVDRQVSSLAPQDVPEYLEKVATQNSNNILEEWWNLGDTLIAKYADGYINLPDGDHSNPATALPVEIGYPSTWLDKTNYSNGPTTYDMK
ncbi:dipeptidase [Maridesulfovibrio bastinii]|uniref:dipeptidase n=1 Tax=Maridesulfovibrio bastinii TaxID=47157 RepID=UPI000429B090|nr:C69 family dipeptidase [Maridesulfovibrio bastinii]